MTHILSVVQDLGGTFVFAISRAAVAVKHRLDIFGMMVLSFAAGNAGGISRDLLIGAVPPAAIADWTYLGVSILAGFLTFYGYSLIARISNPVLWFDAMGLAFFAVAGTQKALLHGLNPAMAALLGMLTGIGGEFCAMCLSTKYQPCYVPIFMLWRRLPALLWWRSVICCTFSRSRQRSWADSSASVCASWQSSSAGTSRRPTD